jgi:NodT family efflux transporter outer membrane factor (OMF) lipoprotein
MLCVLTGCMVGPAYRPPGTAALKIPAAWHAMLPHDGSMVELARWWGQFDDPVLSSLIEAAQADSPTVDSAVARLRQARATRSGSIAALLPKVDGSGSFNRSNENTQAVTSSNVNQPTTLESGELNTTRGALQASWEVDLFGKTRRHVQADSARIEAGVANWHDARVSVAADVADAYSRTRVCEALIEAEQDEQRSRIKTDAVTKLRVQAGFLAPDDAALPQASMAEGEESLTRQRSECEQDRNELVALSGLSRDELDARLRAGYAVVPVPRDGAVTAVPAQAIEQRPDIRSAERSLAAASAEIGEAMAARLPSLSLTGSIEVDQYHVTGQSLMLRPWSFGPALSLPIFDGGSGAANVEAARGRYDEALANYKQKVRQAVMEVENALVRVNSSVQREQASLVAEANYQRYSEATERRFQTGGRDVLEVETARRQYVTGRRSVAEARLERAQAWIALYRAVGGGWQQAVTSDAGVTVQRPEPGSSRAVVQ